MTWFICILFFSHNYSSEIWKNAKSGARKACRRPGRVTKDVYTEASRVTNVGVPCPSSVSGQFQSLSSFIKLPLSSGITRCSNQGKAKFKILFVSQDDLSNIIESACTLKTLQL